MKKLLIILFLGLLTRTAHANDFDVKLNTSNGTSKFSIENSAGVEIASVTSNGDTSFSRYTVAPFGSSSYLLASDASISAQSLTNTGLSFNVGANEVWSFEFFLEVNAGAGGVRWSMSCPAAISALRYDIHGSSSAVNNTGSELINAASPTMTATGFPVNLATGWARVIGVIQNGANAGTVMLQFYAVQSGVTSTVRAGSYVNARKVLN